MSHDFDKEEPQELETKARLESRVTLCHYREMPFLYFFPDSWEFDIDIMVLELIFCRSGINGHCIRVVCPLLCTAFISFLVFVILATTSDDLDTDQICNYQLIPYTILLAGLIGNAFTLVLSLNADLITQYFLKKDSTPYKFSAFAFVLTAVSTGLNVSAFIRRLIEDWEAVIDAPGSTWNKYQCFSLVFWQSSNSRSAIFAFLFILIGVRQLGFGKLDNERVKFDDLEVYVPPHWLNKLSKKIATMWQQITILINLIHVLLTFWTHVLPAFILYPWLTVAMLLIVGLAYPMHGRLFRPLLHWRLQNLLTFVESQGLREKKINGGTLTEFEIQTAREMDSAIEEAPIISPKQRLTVFLYFFIFSLSLILFLMVNQEMAMRFYGGQSYGKSISQTFESRSVKDYMNEILKDFLLTVRTFL